jgi:hypothetical protein
MEVLGGIGKDIAGGINNAINNWAGKADRIKLEEELQKRCDKNVNALVDFYCAGNWDGVINIIKNNILDQSIAPDYDNRVFAVSAIAYAKKGNFEDALRELLSYETDINTLLTNMGRGSKYSEKTVKTLADLNLKSFSLRPLDLNSLPMKPIKEAYSKAQGKEVTDDEFMRFHISFCEKEIKASGNPLWIKKWERLTGNKMTKEDSIRITGDKNLFNALQIESGKSPVQKIAKLILWGIVIVVVAWFVINMIKTFG